MSQAKGVFSKIDRAIGILSGVCVGVASVSLVSIVVAVVVHTTDRKFIHLLKLIFVDEWSGYLFVLMVFFSMALTLRSGDRHIKVSLISRFVSHKTWLVMEILMLLLVIPALLFVTYSSIDRLFLLKEAATFSDTPLMTPLWIPYIFIAVGLVVFTVAVAVHVTGKIIYAVKGAEERRGTSTADSKVGG